MTDTRTLSPEEYLLLAGLAQRGIDDAVYYADYVEGHEGDDEERREYVERLRQQAEAGTQLLDELARNRTALDPTLGTIGTLGLTTANLGLEVRLTEQAMADWPADGRTGRTRALVTAAKAVLSS